MAADSQDARSATRAEQRRGFIGAVAVGGGALVVVLALWLLARGAPSAGGDPLPTLVPTPAPTPTSVSANLRFGMATFPPATNRATTNAAPRPNLLRTVAAGE